MLISVTGGCESTKWAANSIAIGVPFELNFNLDGNSASSSSFSDDFMTAGSKRDHSVVMEFLYKQCGFVKDMNNNDKDCKNSV